MEAMTATTTREGNSRNRRETPVEYVPLREFANFVIDYKRFARWVIALLLVQIMIAAANMILVLGG